MRGGVEAAQVVKVQVEDIACPIGQLFNGIIMKNDGVTIARHMHVEFYGIDGKGECIAKRGQRILRGKLGTAAMGDKLDGMFHRWLTSSFKQHNTTELC